MTDKKPRKPRAKKTKAATLLSDQSQLVLTTALIEHPRNINQGDMTKIAESVEANGFWGGLVAQKSTGHVLVGNHRLRAAKEAGIVELPVFWVDVDDDHALRILLADNRIAEFGKRDEDALLAMLEELNDASDLSGTVSPPKNMTPCSKGWGGGGGAVDPDNDPNYTRKIESPVYTPRGECPKLEQLAGVEKFESLVEEIDASDLDEDTKQFLRMGAARHIVFDYRNIAEFYAQATPALQRLMERSALVIIDFNDAIENGFVKLTEELADAYKQELDSEDDED